MHILLINTSDSSGGAARAAHRIYKGLQSIGLRPKFFVKSRGFIEDNDIISLDSYISRNYAYRVFSWVRSKIKNKIQHYRWGKYPNRENVYMSDMRSTSMRGALSALECDVIHLHWINQRFLPLKELVKIGKPIVVCFNIGGNSDMVEHGVNGYLAKEQDPHDLANGILWVLDQGKAALGEAARQKVHENYTADIVANKYIDVYNSLV